jgi:ribosomal protein S18 acetylase RimI-like enzyme
MDHARRSRPYLELGVFEANEIGRRFYDAYGFEVVERVMNREAGFPELRMRLESTE